MLSVPVAIRMGLSPGSVMGRSFDDIPENLKEVRRAAAKAAGLVIYLPKEVKKPREETRAARTATLSYLETDDDPDDLKNG
jgi:hypothetical protein